MTSGGYLDSNSLGFLICKVGIIITVLLTSQSRDNACENVWGTIKHNVHTLLSRQLIYVDYFTSVVPDKRGITITGITPDQAGVHDVIQQLLPHTDDIHTGHSWKSTSAKDPVKKGVYIVHF